jgi:glycosyltransferase involved in cell wall biosynthesis
MDGIKVSVIMGVYNTDSREMLYAAIDSILNQTLKEIELIVCDDGSTDGTYELLRDIAKSDSRIILLRNEVNAGLAASLNKCIHVAKGNYIARMDADDISSLDRLDEEYKFLSVHSQFAFVGCNCNLVNSKGIYGKRIYKEKPEKKDFLFNSPFSHPTIMIRKEAIISIKGYRVARETKRMEDYDMFMRLYYNHYQGYNLQKFLYNYREDNMTMKKRKYRFRIDEAIIRYKGFKRLKLLPLGYLYVLKPLIVGMIPQIFLRRLKRDTIYSKSI